MCLEIIAMSSDVGCRVFFLCHAYMAASAVQHDANRATSVVVLLFVVCPVLAYIVASFSSCIIMCSIMIWFFLQYNLLLHSVPV